jgi:8-oxo-dGTP pyrophosphatase MutT (NUDIX family)
LTDAAADNPGGADAEGHARRIVRPRDAASLILWRHGPAGPEVLMGKRHAKPPLHARRDGLPRRARRSGRSSPARHPRTAPRHAADAGTARARGRARAIAIAAARELFEETGLVLGRTARRWRGRRPRRAALHLPRGHAGGRPIRFNARFLAAPAEAVHGDIAGSGELEDLDWYTPEAAHRRHVADITGKVLVEFLDWLEMAPRARSSRPLIVFRGMDNRHQER